MDSPTPTAFPNSNPCPLQNNAENSNQMLQSSKPARLHCRFHHDSTRDLHERRVSVDLPEEEETGERKETKRWQCCAKQRNPSASAGDFFPCEDAFRSTWNHGRQVSNTAISSHQFSGISPALDPLPSHSTSVEDTPNPGETDEGRKIGLF